MKAKKLICEDCLRRPVCTGYSAILQPVVPDDCDHFVTKWKVADELPGK